jgi:hypothetical protein
MTKTEAINFSTLQLEDEAHEWWNHGMVMLGHSHINSFREFTKTLMNMVDKMDPKIHFRVLVQLRQTRIVEAFIIEFQCVVMVVTNISDLG